MVSSAVRADSELDVRVRNAWTISRLKKLCDAAAWALPPVVRSVAGPVGSNAQSRTVLSAPHVTRVGEPPALRAVSAAESSSWGGAIVAKSQMHDEWKRKDLYLPTDSCGNGLVLPGASASPAGAMSHTKSDRSP
jgi:hypothetical protein